MAFRFKRGIDVSYDRQGYIYFTSRAYELLPAAKRARIDQLIDACTEDPVGRDALRAFVTTDRTATSICMEHHFASTTSLYRLVKKYYESFPQTL